MKNQRVVTLAIGIGVVAGLRPMMALAAIARAVKRGRIRIEPNPPILWMLSAGTSKKIAQLALSEIIVDKLPFTSSRLKPKLLALRIITGTICGAAVYGRGAKRSVADGAILGGVGAVAGAVTGYHVRQRLGRDIPDFAVALLEDAVAVGGSALVVTLAGSAA
jgi:uncharacterized membrane protein